MAALAALLSPYLDLKRTKSLAVAVSGGADSMSLALLAAELPMKTVALTVNHGLRKEAAKEAAQVAKWLRARKIRHHILTYEGDAPSNNIQEYARELRYRLMAEWCKANGIETLLVGHTMEDQVETLLMRLERGSGVDGLASIPAVQEMEGITLIRPLLSVSKDTLRTYLKTRKQKWTEDPSNTNDKFTRVRVRKLMNEHGEPLFIKRMFDTAVHAGRARSALEIATNELLHTHATLHAAGYLTLDSAFLSEPEELSLRALSNALACISGSDQKPRFEKLQRLYAELQKPSAAITLHGCTVLREKGTITLFREPTRASATKETLTAGAPVHWDGRFLLSLASVPLASFTIRTPDPNDLSTLRKTYKKFEKLPIRREIILSSPALYRTDMLVALPAIGYFESEGLKKAVGCQHSPRSPLVCTPFRYCVHPANTLV